MGWILAGVRWLSLVVLFLFSTVCLATGLYYLAELMEEYERTTKKALRYTSYCVIALHFILLVEGFPITYLLVGVLAHGAYYSLLARFPQISLTNVLFILSIIMFIADHAVWFSYFTSDYFAFSDILGFFVVCVWIVPFTIFIGLTADDNELPYTSVSASETTGDGFSRRRGKQNRFMLWIQNAKQKLLAWVGRKDPDYSYKAF